MADRMLIDVRRFDRIAVEISILSNEELEKSRKPCDDTVEGNNITLAGKGSVV